ncbi:hypothetical protein QJS10_CPA10g01700 [Acorus calamus]|uniref:Uncharacterized protein n=1 Tax=Acorus calamus TaxID=4465 RepID=A0AAV9E2T6_ACOCL|nr:hypothetical protein QJS10_CPA10g01700 [Acorus calamus]
MQTQNPSSLSRHSSPSLGFPITSTITSSIKRKFCLFSHQIKRTFEYLTICVESLPSMAKTKPGKKDLDSYTIKGTNKIVKVGDCVLMRPSDSEKLPYVARVEKIEADHRNNVKVRVRWYYRPEESIGGRRQFHGAKELFLSDHYDVQSAHTIEGKCVVHSFKSYTKLANVGAEDYFCRFEYKAATGGFTPDRVAVYCKCEMPYNPDDLMVQCERCKDWFHPICMGMTIEQAKKLEHFLCSDCSSEDDAKRSVNAYTVSPIAETKVESKRRKR